MTMGNRQHLGIDNAGSTLFAPTPLPEAESTGQGETDDLWATPPAPVAEPDPAQDTAPAAADPLFTPVPAVPDTEPVAALPASVTPPVESDDSALSAALHAWTAQDPAPASADTVVPTAAPGRTALARRIPQQALREAGGAPPSIR